MKKLAFSLLAATLFLAACSKDDNEVPANSFNYNGQVIATTHAYLFDWKSDGAQFAFTDFDLASNYVGTASAIGITLDTLITDQTYTFMRGDSSAYDKKKNFWDAIVLVKQQYNGDDFGDDAEGLENPTGGTVTVKKTGSQDVYNVSYELKYGNTTVKGNYSGNVVVTK